MNILRDKVKTRDKEREIVAWKVHIYTKETDREKKRGEERRGETRLLKREDLYIPI